MVSKTSRLELLTRANLVEQSESGYNFASGKNYLHLLLHLLLTSSLSSDGI
jgi:hypothetical protein